MLTGARTVHYGGRHAPRWKLLSAGDARRRPANRPVSTKQLEAQLNAEIPAAPNGKKPKPLISFTIDGRPFTLADPRQTAASLLRLAGLDPAGYDLGELRGNNPVPKRLGDDQNVHLNDGDRFVSIRERASVA